MTLYRFKWAGYDLQTHVSRRKAEAAKLREQAEIMRARANQIGQEADELQAALVVDENTAKVGSAQ